MLDIMTALEAAKEEEKRMKKWKRRSRLKG
jgi:hypothetical protein